MGVVVVHMIWRPVTEFMQMVLSHDDNIIVSNGQQSPVTSARQPSVKFIHSIIA